MKVYLESLGCKLNQCEREALAKQFVEAGHLVLTLRLENDSLRVYQKGQYNGVIYPESDRVFFGDPHSKESLEFEPDGAGGYYILMDFQGVQWKGDKISPKE